MKDRLEATFDINSLAPYAFKDDQWVAYEDKESAAVKVWSLFSLTHLFNIVLYRFIFNNVFQLEIVPKWN